MIDDAKLRTIVANAGYELEPYSGRAMYGRRCPAITGDRYTCLAGVVAAVTAEADDEDRDEVVALFEESHVGSLGLGWVIYFPRFRWTLGDDDDAGAD